MDEHTRKGNRERQQAYRDRVRRDRGPAAGELATSLRGMHAAIRKAADDGDAWAMQVVGHNPRETAENIVAYARGDRGRLCSAPFLKL
jgi:hypothetical protein